MKTTIKIIVLSIYFLLVGLTELHAQGTNATIGGVVTDLDHEPLAGATVTIRNESTGFQAGTTTTASGEYVFNQVPLGGPYKVRASYIGFSSTEYIEDNISQGEYLKQDFTLSEDASLITGVVVVAEAGKNKNKRIGSATTITPKDMRTMPVNGRNFTSLTALSPLGNGSVLGGQIPSSTAYTIDGMTAKSITSSGTTNRGPYLVSMEAIREFEVVTNDYDVSLGRAGGGTISAVTKQGTNTLEGSAFGYHRADFLSSQYDTRGNKRQDQYSISQFGITLGGPIIKDKMHFFIAAEHQLDARPLYIADLQTVEDEIRYGISKANLEKFIEIARDRYGVSEEQQVGSFDKRRNSTTIMARVDWQLNNSNLLTLRNNFNRDMNTRAVGDNSRINLFEVYGNHLSMDNSLLASLRSVLRPSMTNLLKIQYLYTLDDGRPNPLLPKDNIPRAIIENVKSTINGKEYTLRNIQFGGQRYLPETFDNNLLQISDILYYNTGKINYTFGFDAMFTHLASKATSEMNGRFYYSGMDSFENNTPYRFAREIPVDGDPTVRQGVWNGALFGQAQIHLFDGAELSLGMRGDYTYYVSHPNDSKLLTDELGLSTSNKVASFQFQPRVQFSWDINNRGTDIIRIGAGIFGSNMNNYAMVNNLLFDGQKVLSIEMTHPSYVPIPDFNKYRNDPSTVPGVELFDQLNISKIATYNINSVNTKIPTVYKYSLSYSKIINERLRVGINFYGTHGRNNYMYIDRNMVDEPFFRLSNEGDRGVFVPASTINPKNGNTDWTKGKKTDKIGRVLELVSDGKVNTYTLVADLTYRYYKDGQINISYTWNDSKDNTSYNGNVANSSTLYQYIKDDPRDLSEMSYSNNQFRHKVVVYGTAPSFWGVIVGFRYSGMGGSRYSMTINGNTNGDFVNGNDLAYVFDPKDPNTFSNIKAGIETLLDDPDVAQSFKDYIERSFGKIAERNGGVNPFYGTLDMKIAKSFTFAHKHNVELSVDLFNVMNLFNKKWGLSKSLGKQGLYSVRGFDPDKQQFLYSVNANAGKTSPGGNPWQFQIGLRYSF